ncbi:MAG: ribose 5-phosphate isomerase B [Nitrospirae bacterium]|nr:ribose 5-phosphate isomerase B [Nitrospirota bacterium]MBI3352510.1 ribose 5-phosphate isomerase B [Nitrospirota bacterium]
MKISKVIIGSDHAGFDFKQSVINQLKDQKVEVEDVGTRSKESCDYPDPAMKVAEAVSEGKADRGVLICGSGIGMSIVANKFPGVRAALVHDVETAKLSRRHNNANVLILGERVLNPQRIPEILSAWLDTEFEGGRHQRRLDKIEALEKKLYK